MPTQTSDPSSFSEMLAELVRYFGFNPSGEVQTFQLILGLCAALFAYFLIHRNQIVAASAGRKLERNRLLNELNHEYFAIMARRCVIKAGASPEESYDSAQMLELENVLVRDVIWTSSKLNDDAGHGYRTINQSRYMRVCETYWVDSITLHLMLLWTKRVYHGLQLDVLSPADVMEMWRNILPWAKNNRFSLMAAWFGSDPGQHSITAPVVSLPGWGRLNKTWWRLSFGVRNLADKTDGLLQQLLGMQSPLCPRPPAHWRGDIAALYYLIYVVTDQAIRARRADILGYANPSYTADSAPAGSKHVIFDSQLRKHLLR